MSRKLIIDGNAVYELDENCMLKKRLEDVQTEKNQMEERRRTQENLNEYKRMLIFNLLKISSYYKICPFFIISIQITYIFTTII